MLSSRREGCWGRFLRTDGGPRVAGGRRAAFGMGIVVTRLVWSWWLSGRGCAVGGVRAVVVDFDGTIADSIGHFAGVAADLLVESGALTRSGDATARYLATAGDDFRSQLTEIIPGHAATTSIARRFEAAKQNLDARVRGVPRSAVGAQAVLVGWRPGVRLQAARVFPLACATCCRRTGLLPHLTSVDGWRPGYDKSKQLARALTLAGCGP